jgi:ribonuclease-3
MSAAALQALQRQLGVEFADTATLNAALAHRSYCAEHPEVASNERLEFLGDAVLGLVVTEYAYTQFPQLSEGELAKVRAAVVNAETLADVAAELMLGDAVLLGKGEEASGGRSKPSILSDAVEAVLGALYLDQGWDVTQRCVLRLLVDRIAEAAAGPGGRDFKTRLQELSAQRFDEIPRYVVRHEGPDHAKQFFAEVYIGGVARGTGDGRSKKQAEQHAARMAWDALRADLETTPSSAVGATVSDTIVSAPSAGTP